MLGLITALLTVAHAACEPDVSALTGLLPADGSTEVPQSASAGAFVSGDPRAFDVVLVDAAGDEVSTRRSQRSWAGSDLATGDQSLVLLTPDEELTEGEEYTIIARPVDGSDTDGLSSSFVVGMSVDIAPTPPRLELLAVDDETALEECDHPTARRFQAELTGLDDVWAGSGFVSVYATGSGGGLDRLVGIYAAPADGEILAFDAVLPLDGTDDGNCLSVVAEGEVRKSSQAVLTCPEPAQAGGAGEHEGGGGCSSIAGAVPGLAGTLGALGVLLARRREDA